MIGRARLASALAASWLAAARSEGKVVFYSTLDLQVGALLGKER
ncbi:MAG: hypothetical protein ACLQJR_32000 [Stellaceae bacterium]